MLIATVSIQMAFALFVALAVAERVRFLYARAATSDVALAWLTQRLEAGDHDAALAWAAERPDSHVARVLIAALASANDSVAGSLADPADREAVARAERERLLARDAETRECLLDLREEASARLRMLRVCATLASTIGLLGGILALASAGGTHVGSAGLSRHGLADAIATMAIGVATSALCFQALALLRPAAQRLVTQATQVARTAQLRGGPIRAVGSC